MLEFLLIVILLFVLAAMFFWAAITIWALWDTLKLAADNCPKPTAKKVRY